VPLGDRRWPRAGSVRDGEIADAWPAAPDHAGPHAPPVLPSLTATDRGDPARTAAGPGDWACVGAEHSPRPLRAGGGGGRRTGGWPLRSTSWHGDVIRPEVGARACPESRAMHSPGIRCGESR